MNEPNYQIVSAEPTDLHLIDEELVEWLEFRGINPNFQIDNEAKAFILMALKHEDFESAYIDEENGLIVNFKDDEL